MFAGFASTTPTATHSAYRTYHFVIGAEHILSSALGHSTNRLLSFTSLRDCPSAFCLRHPPPLPPVPRLSATHCPAGGFLAIYDSALQHPNRTLTAHTAIPTANHTQNHATKPRRITIHLHNRTVNTSMRVLSELRKPIVAVV